MSPNTYTRFIPSEDDILNRVGAHSEGREAASDVAMPYIYFSQKRRTKRRPLFLGNKTMNAHSWHAFMLITRRKLHIFRLWRSIVTFSLFPHVYPTANQYNEK